MLRIGRPSANTATMKRIQREIRDVEKEDMGDFTLKPSESNVFNWTATIPGPEGSVYEGGVFKLSITLPPDYPFSSPRVSFETRIYHMNIAPTGAICIDVLKSQWSPALSLFKVMLSISSLLTDPNPKDPLVPAIATEYTSRRKQHDQTAREWTLQYATPPKPPTPAPPKDKGKSTALDPYPTGPSQVNQLNDEPEIIEVSSDVEELIDVDSETASKKAKPRAQVQAPARVAGAKRPSEGEAGPSGGTRSTRRRGGAGETIVID